MIRFVFLLQFFLTYFVTAAGDDKVYPSFESRVHLNHYYSLIPIVPDEISNFTEYDEQLSANDPYYVGKVVEFDSLGYLNEHQTIHHKLAYLIANPALRTIHISPEWCSVKDFFMIGFRIHQIYREQGLPFSVPCATCHPTIEGLNNVYYVLPHRHYYKDITLLGLSGENVVIDNQADNQLIDLEQKSQVSNFQHFLKFNDLYFGEWSRWTGEHSISEEDRNLLGRPDGQLSIYTKDVLKGYTTMCGLELNSETVSSNIFVNDDVIRDQARPGGAFTYKSYETVDLEIELVSDTSMNLQLFISWDKWGCCSACCCPPAICGHSLQTSSDCKAVRSYHYIEVKDALVPCNKQCQKHLQWSHLKAFRQTLSTQRRDPDDFTQLELRSYEGVYSARSRLGYLSIKKIDIENKIVVKTKNRSTELSTTLTRPPYSTRGVPVFSSIFSESDSAPEQLEEIKSILIPRLLAANNIQSYNFTSGMFVKSESCKSHIQKTDCSEWAKCNNFPLEMVKKESSNHVSDTCNQVQFVDVLVGIDGMKVRVGQHENLRIRMDPEVHNMKITKAIWRVNLRKPKAYDKTKPCILQGIVVRNDELLILDFSRYDVKIDLVLNEKQKVRIVFESVKKEVDSQKLNSIVVFWAVTLSVFLLLLVIGSVFMHREKTERLGEKIQVRNGIHFS